MSAKTLLVAIALVFLVIVAPTAVGAVLSGIGEAITALGHAVSQLHLGTG